MVDISNQVGRTFYTPSKPIVTQNRGWQYLMQIKVATQKLKSIVNKTANREESLY